MHMLQETVGAARTIRGELRVPASARIELLVRTGDASLTEVLTAKRSAVLALVGGEALTVGPDVRAPEGAARQVLSRGELSIPLSGVIDLEAERDRLARELEAAKKELEGIRATLANPRFLERAPQAVVDKERGKLEEVERRATRLQENLDSLSAP
jgi:valyl-tRNA synthetase